MNLVGRLKKIIKIVRISIIVLVIIEIVLSKSTRHMQYPNKGRFYFEEDGLHIENVKTGKVLVIS